MESEHSVERSPSPRNVVQIQNYACGGGSPAAHQTQNFAMPHAEVPFKLFWQQSLSSTLDSELSLAAPQCPNQ
jgi:hypothetical protein